MGLHPMSMLITGDYIVVSILQADFRQLGEALNSATAVLELISPCVESSLPKVRWLESFFINCQLEVAKRQR